jgi:hypothetical protein
MEADLVELLWRCSSLWPLLLVPLWFVMFRSNKGFRDDDRICLLLELFVAEISDADMDLKIDSG